LMISPDPVPLPLWPLAAIVTTEGRTLSATDVTSHALTWPDADDAEGVGVAADDFVAATMAPPATPPTTSAPASAAQGSQRRNLRPCGDTCISRLPARFGQLIEASKLE
jgi:hypothetical protein